MTRPRTTFVDLSHPVVSGESGYPGLPAPRIEPHIAHAASGPAYAGRASFEISRAFLVGNSGTYLDSPAHRIPGAPDVASLPLEAVAGLPGVVIDAGTTGAARAIRVAMPRGLRGAAVLFRTGWDARRGTRAYWEPAPFVPGELARELADAGVALVGIDTWNIDDVDDPERPAHTRLLGAGIPIIEHLARLAQLPSGDFRLFAVPAPIVGAASFPVRVFAELPAGGSI